jgi:hypothetical protein
MASDMGNEIERQKPLIENITHKTDKTTLKLENQNKQMNKILGTDRKSKNDDEKGLVDDLMPNKLQLASKLL